MGMYAVKNPPTPFIPGHCALVAVLLAVRFAVRPTQCVGGGPPEPALERERGWIGQDGVLGRSMTQYGLGSNLAEIC